MSFLNRNLTLNLATGLGIAVFSLLGAPDSDAQSHADKPAELHEQLDDSNRLHQRQAFEDVMATNNQVLKKIAMDTAINSGDEALEETALPLIFTEFKSFEVETIQSKNRDDSPSIGAVMAAEIPTSGNLPKGYRANVETFTISECSFDSKSGSGTSERMGQQTSRDDVGFRIDGKTLRMAFVANARNRGCQISYDHVEDTTFIGHGECNNGAKVASRVTFR